MKNNLNDNENSNNVFVSDEEKGLIEVSPSVNRQITDSETDMPVKSTEKKKREPKKNASKNSITARKKKGSQKKAGSKDKKKEQKQPEKNTSFLQKLKNNHEIVERTIKNNVWSMAIFYGIAVASVTHNVSDTFFGQPERENLYTAISSLETQVKLWEGKDKLSHDRIATLQKHIGGLEDIGIIKSLEQEASQLKSKELENIVRIRNLQDKIDLLKTRETGYISNIKDLKNKIVVLETAEAKFEKTMTKFEDRDKQLMSSLSEIKELKQMLTALKSNNENNYLSSLKEIRDLKNDLKVSKSKLEKSAIDLSSSLKILKNKTAKLNITKKKVKSKPKASIKQKSAKTLSLQPKTEKIATVEKKSPKLIKQKVDKKTVEKQQAKLEDIKNSILKERERIEFQRQQVSYLENECKKVFGKHTTKQCKESDAAKEGLKSLERRFAFMKAKENAVLQKLSLEK